MKIIKSLILTSILTLFFSSAFAQLEWVSFEKELPSNAVIGGVETQRALAVCRCEYQGGVHPGKVVGQACNIGWGGKEIIVNTFEVLINTGVAELHWVKTNGPLPDHAVKGGSQKELTIYIGRVFHENGTHPGKVFKVGDKYICNLGYGGKEISVSTFEVLVENHHSDQTTNPLEDHSHCSGDYSGFSVEAIAISSISKKKQVNEGSSIVSPNLKYQTRVTDDGRLVIEEILEHGLCDGKILIFKVNEIWAHTAQKGDAAKDYFFKFQEDGNLCIYSEQAGFVWCSMSNGRDGHHFEITNLGHIEVVNSHGGEVWPD